MSRTPRHIPGEDRGLAAVARVRGVRETDSRIGLQRVLAEEAAVGARLASLTSAVATADVPAVTTAAALVAARTRLAHLGILVDETRAEAATAQVVTADARARWGTDRARLAAVEHLLERRAARRRTEAERRAARDADDLAAQRWARERR
ncbi:flagellar FliJ family protein [Nocardioides sp. L-11A]|uniref:flagellar FliJ family protein n=1 Tax=Nocardioides sp. L-11A TaxID=3043848 RepID=UPI00249BDCBE|nr:flagellar FliJ family protein [Nocardioides sp. L-11A]